MERIKSCVVALFESQRSANKIHQNWQLLANFCSLIIVLRFLNQILQNITSFTFPFRCWLKMRMKSSNLMNSLFANLIPPKIQSWPKFLSWNSCSKSHISINTWRILTNKGLKFKLDCLESKNSHILWINVINFKLRLINFIYIFLRHPVHQRGIKVYIFWKLLSLLFP